MIPWQEIDRAQVPGQKENIILQKRGQEFSIRIAGTELMNSRIHGSEDDLARLTFSCLKGKSDLRILIGGLGMGYTLSAALEQSRPETVIVVSELIPAVVRWNIEHLGHLARMPLDDPRVTVEKEDVAKIIRKQASAWDAILLDVDNGPEGLTQKANECLYSRSGLETSFLALRPGGILSIWSAKASEAFTRRLDDCGFKAKMVSVRARKSGKGSRHIIWLAQKS
ncbi:spermine/spermidine synthase domain-containing protein [Desulfobacula sp.]